MVTVTEELAQLAQLRDSGALSEEEFQAQKRVILARGEQSATPMQPTSKPKSKARRGCLIIAAAFVVLLIVAAIAGGGKHATQTPAAADAPPPIPVTATELFRAYEANELAAQQQYGDRPLLVTGTLDKVNLGIGDEPFLTLKTPNPFMSAQAKLTDESQTKASSLRRGQTVKLLCADVKEVISTPMLGGCAIQ